MDSDIKLILTLFLFFILISPILLGILIIDFFAWITKLNY
jgi:hypothetical protein